MSGSERDREVEMRRNSSVRRGAGRASGLISGRASDKSTSDEDVDASIASLGAGGRGAGSGVGSGARASGAGGGLARGHLSMKLFRFTPLGEDGDVGVSVEEGAEGGGGAASEWDSQAGGHGGAFKAVAEGKELEKVVGEREREFYENAFGAAGGWPTKFLPEYRRVEGEGGKIRLENLVHGMDFPCVLDFKLGTRSVEVSESKLLKKARMKSLDVFTGTTIAGVRLEGMTMHRVLENARVKTSKSRSHFISASVGVTLQDVITVFLTDESGVRDDVALRFQSHIEALLYHFENHNDSTLFIGSSILLVYNNDNQAPRMRWARALASAAGTSPDTLAALTRKTKVAVRMIDFAHTGPLPSTQTRDDGYITGLKSILTALQAIRATRAAPVFNVRSAVSDAVDVERGRGIPPALPATAPPATAPVPSSAPSLPVHGLRPGIPPIPRSAPTQGRRSQLGARFLGRGESSHNFQTLFEHILIGAPSASEKQDLNDGENTLGSKRGFGRGRGVSR